MADNSTAAAGPTVATDDIGGVHYQRTKVVFGVDGTATDASSAAPLPVATPNATASGTITAANANPTSGTPTAGSFVTLAIPDHHTSWTAVIAGTFSAGTTLGFQSSLDGTNWYYTNGRRNQNAIGVNETVSFTSTDVAGGAAPTGGNPSLWKGTAGGVKFIRITAVAYTAADAVTVRIDSSAGPGGTFLLGSIPAGTSQIGTIGELRSATALGTITGAAAAITTLTLAAPGAGLCHYITSLNIDLYSTAARTGVAAPIVVTSTNLTGTPAWTFSTAGVIGAVDRYAQPMATPLRSAVANTATTIVGPAVTGGLWRINAAYFTAA